MNRQDRHKRAELTPPHTQKSAFTPHVAAHTSLNRLSGSLKGIVSVTNKCFMYANINIRTCNAQRV